MKSNESKNRPAGQPASQVGRSHELLDQFASSGDSFAAPHCLPAAATRTLGNGGECVTARAKSIMTGNNNNPSVSRNSAASGCRCRRSSSSSSIATWRNLLTVIVRKACSRACRGTSVHLPFPCPCAVCLIHYIPAYICDRRGGTFLYLRFLVYF